MDENMFNNFEKLQSRVLTSIDKTDLSKIKEILGSINEPTLTSGVGGSYVVSNFLSKVLSKKNNIVCENTTPRDIVYRNLKCYKNIIACSYSGKNLGVDVAFNNNLNRYLLSKNEKEGIINLNYKVLEEEHSFISLSSTLIPMTILLLYYYNDINLIKEILSYNSKFEIISGNIYEILSGYDTSTASSFIESTMVESGIGIPIVHDKYDYCHGRSTLDFYNKANLVFFNCDKELDQLYKKELGNYYQNVIEISKKFDDEIINDYYFTYLSMLLCKQIAEKKGQDLSCVDYSPLVKKLYYYKGEM